LVVAFEPGDNQQTIMYENVKYIIRRLTPTECGRLQGLPDGWADSLETENITADDIDYWKLIFQQHAESLGIVKKDKTDNQIKKWLSNPESDTAKYKMWGNGIALPCAAFVMEGIAHELQRRSMKEITINVPDGTQLLHVLAVIDKGKEIHYEAKFCDLRDSKLEYTLDSCNKEGEWKWKKIKEL
jgi:DNA (cytosine-5-)-methyltransferase